MKAKFPFIKVSPILAAAALTASFISSPALADKMPKVNPQQAEAPSALEARIISEVLTQFFNSLRRVNVDFQLNSLILSSDKPTTRDVVVNAQAYFAKDITVDLFQAPTDLIKNTDAIIPRINVDAKDLFAKGTYREYPTSQGPVVQGSLDFANFKTGKPRFVNIKAENDLIPNIFSITLQSAKLSIKDGQVRGSCESEKNLTDIHTGKVKAVKMICEVKGTINNGEYSLEVKYVDKK